MAVIAEGVVTIQESSSGTIQSVRWGISPWPVTGGEPTNVSYLRFAHGQGSPQALVMAVGDEEVIMFWPAPDSVAQRVHQFLQHTKRTIIAGVDTDPEGGESVREWEVECSVFQDYMETLLSV